MSQSLIKIFLYLLLGLFIVKSLNPFYGQPYYLEANKYEDPSSEGGNTKTLLQFLFTGAEEILLEPTFKKQPKNFSDESSFIKILFNSSFIKTDFSNQVDFPHKKGDQFSQLFLLFCCLKIDFI